MRITCEIEFGETDGDYGTVSCTSAECSRCEHMTEVYGDSDRSVRAALVKLREECPNGESNFYVAAGGEDQG